jgi:hypothetical protein
MNIIMSLCSFVVFPVLYRHKDQAVVVQQLCDVIISSTHLLQFQELYFLQRALLFTTVDLVSSIHFDSTSTGKIIYVVLCPSTSLKC